ncbi:molybdenum cofactor guanylyltransferase [Sunxiuqinia sp. A32]|uniref:molybdenum cofactor guanylyltransferase n=1 Tax=Sunxiuqinia sp. A32 TaxID=3461496 RepID=UPI00404555C2
MEISGIILAGGKSSRMGQDKGLMEFNGKKLVEYAIKLLNPICSEILIISNQSGYDGFGNQVVSDNFQGCGPIGGLEAGLKKVETDWNIVISCDTPFLQKELFVEMMNEISNQDAIIPTHSKGIEPLAGIYHKRLSTFFEEKIKADDLKLRKIIKEKNVFVFEAQKLVRQFPDIFYNLNSPEDLSR